MINNKPSPVLLVGNGPNQLDGGYSWRDLIRRLREFVGSGEMAPHDEEKPFPLLYEELVLQGYNHHSLSEEQIKYFICQEIQNFKPNEIHTRLVKMNIEHILTTNYDHALEKAASDIFQESPKSGRHNESRYSLFRKNQFETKEPKTIWHLHGDQERPDTVLLGYDHYSGYLQAMYRYVRRGYDSNGESWSSLLKQLKNNQFEIPIDRSWIDFFFTRDIYILGLSLDFVEFHLWWLLTFRPRAEIRSDIRANRVVYLYRDLNQAPSANVQAKLSLFEGIKVQAQPLKVDTGWKDFYNSALDWIDNDIINHPY